MIISCCLLIYCFTFFEIVSINKGSTAVSNSPSRYLIELEVDYIRASEPQIVFPDNNNINISEGKTLIVKCRAKGQPKPKIIWIKDKLNLPLRANVKISKEENEITDNRSIQLMSTLEISKISHSDSGNYTCKAENNHGSIQKWVYVAVQSVLPTTPLTTASYDSYRGCPPLYCLNDGNCISYSGGSRFCNCSQPFYGERCELRSEPLGNISTVCREKVLDCFHRTDRILTFTGIGLVLTMFLLILLISWYLARQRKRDFESWNRTKHDNEEFKCIQTGPPLLFAGRTVGTDVEHDLCVIDNLDNLLHRSVTFPTQEYTPKLHYMSAAAVGQSDHGSLPRTSPDPAAFFYRPLRSLPSGDSGMTTGSNSASPTREQLKYEFSTGSVGYVTKRTRIRPAGYSTLENDIWLRRGYSNNLDDGQSDSLTLPSSSNYSNDSGRGGNSIPCYCQDPPTSNSLRTVPENLTVHSSPSPSTSLLHHHQEEELLEDTSAVVHLPSPNDCQQHPLQNGIVSPVLDNGQHDPNFIYYPCQCNCEDEHHQHCTTFF